MFGMDEDPHGKLDMDASFQIGNGLRSWVAWVKLVTFAIAVASLVHGFATDDFPSFYPAFLTPWGVFFGILQLGGSFALTVFYSSGYYNPKNANVLVKLTWLLYSIAGVIGICISGLYWVFVFDPNNTDGLLGKIMRHGGVVLIVLLQGIFLDKVPTRLKHIVFSDGVAVIMSAWLAIQNTVVRYNPNHDDDDDALYDAIKWREETTRAIILTVLIVFAAVPVVHLLVWLMSVPGRRYLRKSEENEVVEEVEITDSAVEEGMA